ncbi:resolvase [Vibrio ishigakensis]|uniref:Resolvase n=1 Tax=Vibrio ishigakensis TaxID=1481914 RepID=A0A0B8PML2_9VIBR|nr:resolvase [Vibrio ishigakensis]
MQHIYSRVSTAEQNVQQQTELLLKHYPEARVWEDKLSGKNMEREQFQLMQSHLRQGDTVICYDISRLGRNVVDVLKFCEAMTEQGVKVVVHTLGSVDVTSATGKMVLTTLASVAEMQRTEMLEKQAIGIERAKAEGKFKGKQVSEKTLQKVEAVDALVASGTSASKALTMIGLSRSTYYKHKQQ